MNLWSTQRAMAHRLRPVDASVTHGTHRQQRRLVLEVLPQPRAAVQDALARRDHPVCHCALQKSRGPDHAKLRVSRQRDFHARQAVVLCWLPSSAHLHDMYSNMRHHIIRAAT